MYEYAPDTTKVEAKFPEMVNVLAALFAMPVPPFAVPNIPVTPVVSGKPVTFVITPLAGVPKAGVTKDNEFANIVLETVPVSPVVTIVPVVAGTAILNVDAVLGPFRLT